MDYGRKAKIISAVVTAVVTGAVVILLLFLYLRYTGDKPRVWPPEDTSELLLEGEYVQLGDIPQPDMDESEPAPESQSEPENPAEEMVDAGTPAPEPAPIVSSKVESPMKVKEQPKPEKTGPTKEELAQLEKEKKQKEAAEKISKRVNFGGTSNGSSASQGKSGSPNGNAATGALSGQPGTNLKGRTLASWSNPKAQAIGSIKISVRVNRKGQVTSAEYYNGSGPVASMQAARESCIKAALQSKFSVDEDAPAEQTGLITYTFE